MKLKLEQYQYTCKNYNHGFISEVLPGDYNYGRFLLRSSGMDNLAYLNLIESTVFPEFEYIIDNSERINAFQYIFTISCDPDIDGSEYYINLAPKCSKCDKRQFLFFTGFTPLKYVEKNVPIIIHSRWDILSFERKKSLIVTTSNYHFMNIKK